MVDLIALTNALTTTLQAIPELVAELPGSDPNRIVAYIDVNPAKNSTSNTIYEMPSGLIYVIHEGFRRNEKENDASMWTHKLMVHCRADTGKRVQDMVRYVVDGVPVPGDGQRWRACGIMDGVSPADIQLGSRQPDREGIDFFTVEIDISETGDA